MSFVSIVSPSLNTARFLEATLSSVVGQEYPAIEYIVVDGGSSDGTLEILSRYQNELTLILEPNPGQSAAINKGWRHSSGDIVAWLNCDDTYLPGSVERVADFMSAHPDVDVVYGDCLLTDGGGQTIERYHTQPYDYVELVRSAINYIPQPATFIRRRVLDETGYLNEDMDYVMDYDYWLRIGLKHEVMFLPGELATLRLHDTAKSVDKLKGFGPELIQLFVSYFGRRDLRSDMRQLQREAMMSVYRRAADSSFWGGAYLNTLLFGMRALRLSRLKPAPALIALLGLACLGPIGRKIAAARSGDPYRKHLAG